VAKRDYYEVLEVHRQVTVEEIKKAYRKKALEFHPDRNPGNKESEEKFKEATEAYSVLSDADNRRKYDQFGHAAFQQGGGFQGGDFSDLNDLFGDIFSSFFGGGDAHGGGGRSKKRAGRDLKYDMEVTFEEAAFGTEREIKINKRTACETCKGSGAESDSAVQKCTQCAGHGQVRVSQGFFTMTQACPACNGTGQVIKKPCKSCSGTGLKSAQNKLNVKIPPGIDNGQRLKLRGEGEAGPNGGSAGDLYVQVMIKEHAIFQRQEAEVICEVPISYATAVLGDEIEVPTLDGRVKLKIPTGTASGKVFRLKNRGIQILGTTRRGDHHVRVFVDVPKKVSEEKKKLLQQLAVLEKKNPEGETKGFFDKVKEMFA
jgi:molecular chaperone DnaJ